MGRFSLYLLKAGRFYLTKTGLDKPLTRTGNGKKKPRGSYPPYFSCFQITLNPLSPSKDNISFWKDRINKPQSYEINILLKTSIP